MNHEYTRHAQLQAVYDQLIRDLREKYVDTESAPRTIIVCEKVFYEDREVPETVVLDALTMLIRASESEQRKLERFEFRKREEDDDNPPAEVRKPVKEVANEPAEPQRRQTGTDRKGGGN